LFPAILDFGFRIVPFKLNFLIRGLKLLILKPFKNLTYSVRISVIVADSAALKHPKKRGRNEKLEAGRKSKAGNGRKYFKKAIDRA